MQIYHRLQDIYFTTATILEWKRLLKPDKYKDIVVSSLKYLVDDKRVVIYAFVIMPNHIHIVWEIAEPYTLSKVQLSLLKFTAQKIKFDLKENHPKVLEHFKVDKADRIYQFWQRKPLSIGLNHYRELRQKVNYVNANPIQEKSRLVTIAEDYKYSSAKFYAKGIDDFGFLTDYRFAYRGLDFGYY